MCGYGALAQNDIGTGEMTRAGCGLRRLKREPPLRKGRRTKPNAVLVEKAAPENPCGGVRIDGEGDRWRKRDEPAAGLDRERIMQTSAS